jgi:HK97 family phage prohead protease
VRPDLLTHGIGRLFGFVVIVVYPVFIVLMGTSAHVEHSKTVVGSIDPNSMHPTDAGLVVAGEVDRATDEGQQVWRSIKSGTAGFSIGYMSEGRPRKGGGQFITEIDLLEISATSTPMHPATRALSWKAPTTRLRRANGPTA